MCNKMSDVRLSNASPTLERVDARQPDAARPSVRRNLFGSPDREDIRRYLDSAIQEGVRDFREEYNFDPVTDRPLPPPRRYEWEEAGDAPEFYRRPPHGSQRPRRDAEAPGEASGDREGSRKRRSGAPGPCATETHSKRSHTDEDDDEDESGEAVTEREDGVQVP
ncbi:cyclin-dependent kinase inhibitor 1B-like [Antennarius striatus]|uniref:cyclin-dependent kinase inhibitor 1B-like n=1 Tax=Antennarius striatus TaxID=241820 RepID=UPI0035B49C1C